MIIIGTSLAARAYAVTASAHDSESDLIAPTDGYWRFSPSLDAHFQYSPELRGTQAFILRSWKCPTYIDSVGAEVVAWMKDQECPRILAMAFSPAQAEELGTRTWTVVNPSTGARP